MPTGTHITHTLYKFKLSLKDGVETEGHFPLLSRASGSVNSLYVSLPASTLQCSEVGTRAEPSSGEPILCLLLWDFRKGYLKSSDMEEGSRLLQDTKGGPEADILKL